jgi:hypothetical protein
MAFATSDATTLCGHVTAAPGGSGPTCARRLAAMTATWARNTLYDSASEGEERHTGSHCRMCSRPSDGNTRRIFRSDSSCETSKMSASRMADHSPGREVR